MTADNADKCKASNIKNVQERINTLGYFYLKETSAAFYSAFLLLFAAWRRLFCVINDLFVESLLKSKPGSDIIESSVPWAALGPDSSRVKRAGGTFDADDDNSNQFRIDLPDSYGCVDLRHEQRQQKISRPWLGMAYFSLL